MRDDKKICLNCSSELELKEGYDFYNDYRWEANYYYCAKCDDYFNEEDYLNAARIKTAQYSSDEFWAGKKVTNVKEGESGLEVIITYSDGSEHTATGLFAVEILKGVIR